MSDHDLEVYECHGCAGEVSVVEAIWGQASVYDPAKPYCCSACMIQTLKVLLAALELEVKP